MISDNPFEDADDSPENVQKRGMREKMFFSILHTELREFPELLQMVYSGKEHPKFLDAFYGKEFKEIFLPVFYSRLFELSGNGLSWEEVSRGQIDSDWNVPLPTSPKISKVEIRRAMRESIVFLTQHRMEETYLAALKEREKLPTEVSDARRLQVRMDELNDLIQKLGEMEVFGKKLSETGSTALERNGGKTRAELVAQYLFQHANDLTFAVPQDTVSGLPEGFSFGARGAIYRKCVADIGLRTELDKVHPHTTDEPEGRVYDPVLVRLFSLENWLPSSVETTDSKAKYAHYARFVANGVSSEARLPDLPENASADAAKQRMTEAAIVLAQKEENRGRGFVRSDGLERMYMHDSNTPAVFVKYDIPRSRGNIGNDYPRMESCIRSLRYPPQRPEEQFSFDNVVAVFFEARILGNGHAMVLATYVYGDPLSGAEPPEFFVMQSTRGTYAISNGNGEMGGSDRVIGGRNFLLQNGAREMISQLSVPLEKRRQQTIERRRKKHEEEKKLGEKRAEMLQQQELARQTAKRNPGVWHAYPHEYLDSHKGERRHEHVAYYCPPESESGYFLYLRKPIVSTGTFLDSADKTYKKTTGNSSTTRIEVVDEKTGANYYFNHMGGWYLTFLQEQNTSIPREIFTEGLCMPIPENPLGSVRKIIALFVSNIDDPEHRESENLLLEQYKKLETNVQRREFLRRLEFTARKFAGDGKNAITKIGFEMLLAQYGALYSAPLDRGQWERFTRGHELCGQPDENGIYTVEKTKGLSPLSVYTRFSLEQGKWEWSPDREHWLAPSLVNVWHTDSHYYSPSGNAIAILRQLEA
ncbi:MAG: hypothetical protein UY87_C0015G0002 [Candidatus Peribacteria bacterium GW2011_GWC2_54_8]|nr:MAG: hypothetical protein UY87_C0015G0002 [Candidatus Peribacteria bacterium GW2011_GWC2_54_8]